MKIFTPTDTIMYGYEVTANMSDVDDIVNACPTLTFGGFAYDANANIIGVRFMYLNDSSTTYTVEIGGYVLVDATGIASYASQSAMQQYTEIVIV